MNPRSGSSGIRDYLTQYLPDEALAKVSFAYTDTDINLDSPARHVPWVLGHICKEVAKRSSINARTMESSSASRHPPRKFQKSRSLSKWENTGNPRIRIQKLQRTTSSMLPHSETIYRVLGSLGKHQFSCARGRLFLLRELKFFFASILRSKPYSQNTKILDIFQDGPILARIVIHNFAGDALIHVSKKCLDFQINKSFSSALLSAPHLHTLIHSIDLSAEIQPQSLVTHHHL